MRRAFVVVLDACGVGAAEDAADYGDAGTNTLGHLAQHLGGLHLPTLERLGLGSILPLAGVAPSPDPVLHGRLGPLGPGKDSTAGHWGLMGVASDRRPPTYPGGFPPEVIEVVRAASGRDVICNRPDNGLTAIEEFGAAHVAGGDLIVYTSQDSVLQIAAHVDVVGTEELYDICRRVRARTTGEHAVGRVIARPFAGTDGAFERTDGRRDFALAPPAPSYLEALQAHGIPVHSVGKVGQLFAGVGIDVEHPGATNDRALDETTVLLAELDRGLVFTNLIETDQVYGHRHDFDGFAGALRGIDDRVAGWLELLRAGDLLILTADHGCDLTSPRTDHTREQAPLLARFAGHDGRRHDGVLADVGASVLAWLGRGTRAPELPGRSSFNTGRARAPRGRDDPPPAGAPPGGPHAGEVEILDPRWTRPEPPRGVERALRGRVVEEVGRAGKYLVWRLSGERFLLMHLRMTGALLFDPPADPPHTRARFALDDGHRLVYNDPRRFGTGHLVTGAAGRDAYLGARLGVEPLTPGFTAEHLRAQARGRSAPVKSFVLDQRRIAGVGNIYADEALFRARIHPLRSAGSLTRRAMRGPARGHRARADGRDRRQGRDHR